MRESLDKAVKYKGLVDMVYEAKDGMITKRRVKILQVGESSFRAYCYLRQSKRTFVIDNILALFPVIERKRAVI